MNIKKTECMVNSKKKTYPQCTIFITSDSKCDQEIKRRIVLEKDAFSKMKSILTNSKITMATGQMFQVMQCIQA